MSFEIEVYTAIEDGICPKCGELGLLGRLTASGAEFLCPICSHHYEQEPRCQRGGYATLRSLADYDFAMNRLLASGFKTLATPCTACSATEPLMAKFHGPGVQYACPRCGAFWGQGSLFKVEVSAAAEATLERIAGF